MISFSLDAITSFSHVPLKLATSLGFVLAGISLVAILIAVILPIFTGAIVGQASTFQSKRRAAFIGPHASYYQATCR